MSAARTLQLLRSISTRAELPALFEQLGVSRAVEVGVRTGVHLRTWLRQPCIREVVGVDPWSASGPRSTNDHGAEQRVLDKHYSRLSRQAAQDPRLRLLRGYSPGAMVALQPGYDFIYLDADHTEAAVREDIRAAWPLVRPGGILGGHDYYTPKKQHRDVRFGVVEAVNAFVLEEGLADAFVVLDGDPSPTWLVVKPEGG